MIIAVFKYLEEYTGIDRDWLILATMVAVVLAFSMWLE